jgi:hypothetical protein
VDSTNNNKEFSGLKGFMNAHDKVRAIEEEVSIELHKDWLELEKEKKDKAEINKNIEEFYQRMLSKTASHQFRTEKERAGFCRSEIG